MSGGGLIVVGDGRRPYLERALASVPDYPFATRILVDDSGDHGYHEALRHLLPDWTHVHHEQRQGGAASVRSAFEAVRKADVDWWLHLEEDFVLLDCPIPQMLAVLDRPGTAQVALMRQPVNPDEYGAGNWLRLHGGHVARTARVGTGWVEFSEQHRLFVLNPMICRAEIAERYDWPDNGHEHHFTRLLRADGWSFAVFGRDTDPPRCEHIGTQRSEGWAW